MGTEVFEGSFSDLSKFVPEDLTKRQITSKYACLFDPMGKYCPVSGAMKVNLRRVVLETSDWDDVVSKETRAVWLRNFWRLQQLKGLQFNRARVPTDAANTNVQLVAAVDASNELKAAAVYARFLRTNGQYSSQLIIGRT